MRMILRVFPYSIENDDACQCLLYCDGKYTTVEYSSDGRVLTRGVGYLGNYEYVVKHINEWLLRQL